MHVGNRVLLVLFNCWCCCLCYELMLLFVDENIWNYSSGKIYNDYLTLLFYYILQYIGITVILITGILTYRALRYMNLMHLKHMHASIACIILVLLVFGYWTILDNHNYQYPPKPHWFSLHSWLGITATLLFLSQVSNY